MSGTPVDLDAIKARMDAATPGPWRWSGNVDNHGIRLFSTTGPWKRTVMDFVRWGMGGAAPRFQFKDGGMVRADEYVRFEVAPDATERSDRRVYRGDITAIRHPDAEFIAHAREDVAVLVAEVERLRGIVQRVEDVAPRIRDDRKGVAEGWAWAVREVRGLLSPAPAGDVPASTERQR